MDGKQPGVEVDYTVPEFSYKAFPLGYINIGGVATYLTRLPARQQAQGLAQTSIIGYPGRPNYPNWFTSREMKDCILGVYPGLANAEQDLETYQGTSIAIAREVAIKRQSGDVIALMYRGRVVGYKKENNYWLLETREKKVLTDILKEHVCLC
jgi:hypothetical protein